MKSSHKLSSDSSADLFALRGCGFGLLQGLQHEIGIVHILCSIAKRGCRAWDNMHKANP